MEESHHFRRSDSLFICFWFCGAEWFNRYSLNSCRRIPCGRSSMGDITKAHPWKAPPSGREQRKNYDNVDNPLDKRRIRVDRNKNKLSANYCAVRFAEITPVSRRAGAAEPSVRLPPDVRGWRHSTTVRGYPIYGSATLLGCYVPAGVSCRRRWIGCVTRGCGRNSGPMRWCARDASVL